MTGGRPERPHHDGSPLYVAPGTPRLVDRVPVRRGASGAGLHLPGDGPAVGVWRLA